MVNKATTVSEDAALSNGATRQPSADDTSAVSSVAVTLSQDAAEEDTSALSPVPSGVTVKGWRNGLLLILPQEDAWDSVMQQVHTKLDEAQARSFWRGAQTTIDCGTRVVPRAELSALADFTRRSFGLVPVAVVATDAATRSAAQLLGLAPYTELPVVKKPARDRDAKNAEAKNGDAKGEENRDDRQVSVAAEVRPTEKETVSASPFAMNNALYVPNTVRSGQRLVHDGHLIIGGDVNAGAEVMAGGDVVVMGTLRGLAHAGCYGDENARIVAGSLRPPQLRIATRIARSPEEPSKQHTSRTPEIARIENGEIGIFPL